MYTRVRSNDFFVQFDVQSRPFWHLDCAVIEPWGGPCALNHCNTSVSTRNEMGSFATGSSRPRADTPMITYRCWPHE